MDPDLDAKRALQDFSSLHQCLTNELWQTIWNLEHYQKEEGVLNYAFDLELFCRKHQAKNYTSSFIMMRLQQEMFWLL